MADDPTSPAARVRGLVARARQAPAALDDLTAELAAVRAEMAALHRDDGRDDGRGGDEALAGLAARLDRLQEMVTTVDGAVGGHAAALHRAVAAPARQAAFRALVEDLGPAPALRPGLSVFTLCWNHGGLLADAVRSGLAVLDHLAPHERGELLIFDDASTDSTPSVAAALAAEDHRVRVIRAPLNLGLALARTALLHACSTTHAFQLDADNTACPAGVADLYRAAIATGAALTYGTVVQAGMDGSAVGPVSNEPPTSALFRSNYVDTMAVTDIATYRRLGGWSPDPLVEHVDDWWGVWRLVEAGLLITFVPTVVGRYSVLRTSFHLTVADSRIGANRVARLLDPTGRRQDDGAVDGVAAVAYDPVAGPLWATPEALRHRPDLAPPAPSSEATPPVGRVLVVAPGGADAIGDVVAIQALERLRHALVASSRPGGRPEGEIAVDLVTDGGTAPTGRGAARWLGTLAEAVAGLPRDDATLSPDASPIGRAPTGPGEGKSPWSPFDPSAYRAAILVGGEALGPDARAGRAVVAAALRAARVPYACSGVDAPAPDDEERQAVAGLLAGAVAVAGRDEEAVADVLVLPDVDPSRVVATGDDALGASDAAPVDPALPRTERPLLAVVLADVGDGDGPDEQVRAWALAADALAAERSWDVLGLALGSSAGPDIVALAALRATAPLRARWHVVDCSGDPRHLVAAIRSSVAVAAQRTTAVVIALDAGVPAVLDGRSQGARTRAGAVAQLAGLPAALAVTDPEGLAAGIAAVEAALPPTGTSPFSAAAAALDAWWAALPGLLGLAPPR